MEEDTLLPFAFPAVARKKVSAAFDGGMLSSDGGVLILRDVEKRLGIAERLASCLKDRRDRDLITHTIEDMLRLRMFAIAAGYEDVNDFTGCVTIRSSRWRSDDRRKRASPCARSRRCRGSRTRPRARRSGG